MRRRLRANLPLLRLAVAALCAFAFGAAAAADEPKHAVLDPHYGDTLFHFYQDQYFTSITTLMASQHFERVSHHADEAEVLRGGMLLSYGMPNEAGQIFARLIEKGATPSVRDRAWFYLAKIRYQRGYLAEAEDAIGRIQGRLPAALEEDRGLLLANLLMGRADYAGAAGALATVSAKTQGARYIRYNLGVALIKAGEPVRGTAILDALGRAGAENEEYRSLRDRANVALGFTALADKQPKAARTYLERVRLTGLEANKALLGFGWAAAALKEPALALVPWMELAKRDVGDSAALESQIAVPYAYAELGAYGQALERYNDAIAAFDREDTGLDESVASLRRGRWVDALVDRNPGDEMGWFWTIRDLPELPHARHLAQLFAQHEFQEAFKNYRDLRFLAKNLEEWRDKLGVFNDMLATKRKAYAERLPLVRDRASQIDLEAVIKRRDGVAAEIAQAGVDADGVAFADAKEVELLGRLRRVNNELAKAEGGAPNDEMTRLRARARLAAGALSWQLAEGYTARVWSVNRELGAIDAGIADARRRDAALGQAQRDEPVRFERFAARIAAIYPLLQTVAAQVAALSNEQKEVAQDIAIAEMTRQKERLADYSTQARFAVAELYDRANFKKEGDHAAKP